MQCTASVLRRIATERQQSADYISQEDWQAPQQHQSSYTSSSSTSNSAAAAAGWLTLQEHALDVHALLGWAADVALLQVDHTVLKRQAVNGDAVAARSRLQARHACNAHNQL
jgi:hypothetical protein